MLVTASSSRRATSHVLRSPSNSTMKLATINAPIACDSSRSSRPAVTTAAGRAFLIAIGSRHPPIWEDQSGSEITLGSSGDATGTDLSEAVAFYRDQVMAANSRALASSARAFERLEQ